LPATGRNHTKTHRTEFNKRMGRWICGCGWKSEPKGARRHKRQTATTDAGFESDEETSSRESYGSNQKDNCQPVVTFCVVCEYESEAAFDICPRCRSEGRAVLVLRKA
jgi:hypothetical protein